MLIASYICLMKHVLCFRKDLCYVLVFFICIKINWSNFYFSFLLATLSIYNWKYCMIEYSFEKGQHLSRSIMPLFDIRFVFVSRSFLTILPLPSTSPSSNLPPSFLSSDSENSNLSRCLDITKYPLIRCRGYFSQSIFISVSSLLLIQYY